MMVGQSGVRKADTLKIVIGKIISVRYRTVFVFENCRLLRHSNDRDATNGQITVQKTKPSE